ncbi:MAG: ATP-binding protein [Myxococcales bacterium]|nr:ATP-binding protein [Myxococcales bacterium]
MHQPQTHRVPIGTLQPLCAAGAPYSSLLAHLQAVLDYVERMIRRSVDPTLDEPLRALRQQIDERVAATLATEVPVPLATLTARLELSPIERDLVALLVGLELSSSIARIFRYAWDGSSAPVTVGRVAHVVGTDDLQRLELVEACAAEGRLRRHHLIVVAPLGDDVTATTENRAIAINRRVASFVRGQLAPAEELIDCAEWRAAADPDDLDDCDPETRSGFLRAFERAATRRKHLNLWGPDGAGRRELVATAIDRGQGLLAVDLRGRLESLSTLGKTLDAARLEATLTNAMIYLDLSALETWDELPEVSAALLRHFLARCDDAPLVVASRFPLRLNDALISCHVPTPGREIRERLWNRALADECALRTADVDPARLATQFPLGAAQIEAAVQLASDRAAVQGRRPVDQHDLSRAAREQLDSPLDKLAQRIPHHVGWEDVVLSDELSESLAELRTNARHLAHLNTNWGFAKKSPSARGLSVLLAGPPGTGKTLVASVLAAELGLELFKVDLSQAVSKWVGETEKNLGKIFDAAETSPAVLLFDEADALFAKRTEVKSSNDRYANLEVGYLLQRMESFGGISILTTNLTSSIDDAFKRRIHFRLTFPFPDEGARARLWRTLMPAEAPLAPNIDYERLGQMFELSGGHIRLAIRRAAAQAREHGAPISFRELARAGVKECQEIGKLVRADREIEAGARRW